VYQSDTDVSVVTGWTDRGAVEAVTCAPGSVGARAPQAYDGRSWRVLLSRGLRGTVDGTVSVLFAGYLTRFGLSPVAVGAIVTATLFGSGVLTLGVGVFAHRFPLRRLLLFAAALMAATGSGSPYSMTSGRSSCWGFSEP
jgi:MFS family permease